MPIRPQLRGFYPIDWKQLSAVIRFERAKGRCETCGRPHGKLVQHLGDGRWWDEERGAGRPSAIFFSARIGSPSAHRICAPGKGNLFRGRKRGAKILSYAPAFVSGFVSRLGSSRSRALRRNGVIFFQSRASQRVRPQATHQPVLPANSQTPVQGLSLLILPPVIVAMDNYRLPPYL